MTAPANWHDQAACRDADPDLFFPAGPTGPALRQVDEAKRICRSCPVEARCLAWALDHGVTDGVWGGTTEDERRAIRRPPRRMTIGHEGDGGNSYHSADHAEHGIHAPNAQGKQPGFSATLELSADRVRWELRPPEIPRAPSAPESARPVIPRRERRTGP
jgi:WhiB family transcriptional regulator, redox-sensing transcriptional regulator